MSDPAPHMSRTGRPEVDDMLDQVVHQLLAANLDLHSVLGVFSRQQGVGRDRVHAVIDRLDDTIAAIHHAGARLQISLADEAALNQAKGALAARRDISVAEASDLITGHASRHALDVSVVARAVLAGDHLPSAGS
ncbi:ANTAR domain-containing protein [Lentzea flava]|uniref:ANTAR domain-containing protein n=1 Tax=Lentzea flava TaxID=103732 RepID=UPI00166FB88C|nr:ANTAR domain-containing protein [Lentzea flava]